MVVDHFLIMKLHNLTKLGSMGLAKLNNYRIGSIFYFNKKNLLPHNSIMELLNQVDYNET